jgi:predicted O-methyltransferase YrrM
MPVGRAKQEHLKLEPDTSQTLPNSCSVMRSSRRKQVLEIDISNGPSTIWFAWAASTLCDQVISIDRDAHKHKQSVANVLHAGLREMLDLTCLDTREIVADPSGPLVRC